MHEATIVLDLLVDHTKSSYLSYIYAHKPTH